MGLLTPKDEAMLALGLGLLSSKGSFGNALGQAGMLSLNTLNQAQDRERVAKMRELQEEMARMNMETAKRQQAQMQRADEFRNSLQSPMQQNVAQALGGGGGPTVANAQKLQPVDPNQALMFDAMKAGLVDPVQYIASQRKDSTPLKVGAGETLLDPRTMKPIFENKKDDKGTSDMQEFLFAQQRGEVPEGTSFTDWMRANKRAGASSVSVSTFPPMAGIGPDGKPAFVVIDKATGLPKVVPGVRPPMSGAEEKAEQEKSNRERQSKQMLSVLDDAEKILSAGRATASGVGQKMDEAARFFGSTTKGAQDAARLEALSGWLVANVPRMEGPQSNFDVENYKTMAGKVGNSTIPIAERKAALSEVRRLQRKYSDINGTPQAPASGWSIKKVE